MEQKQAFFWEIQVDPFSHVFSSILSFLTENWTHDLFKKIVGCEYAFFFFFNYQPFVSRNTENTCFLIWKLFTYWEQMYTDNLSADFWRYITFAEKSLLNNRDGWIWFDHIPLAKEWKGSVVFSSSYRYTHVFITIFSVIIWTIVGQEIHLKIVSELPCSENKTLCSLQLEFITVQFMPICSSKFISVYAFI